MTILRTMTFGAALLLLSCSSEQPAAPSATANKNVPAKYVPVSQALYDEIRQQDSILFAAFNAHDADRLMTGFSDDLEFYHDKGGLADHAATRKGFEQLFAASKTTGMRRELVPGSLEVYPIGDYGALEVCRHRFCHRENGKDDCGTFKNIMVWEKTTAGWQVKRVISYDH